MMTIDRLLCAHDKATRRARLYLLALSLARLLRLAGL